MRLAIDDQDWGDTGAMTNSTSYEVQVMQGGKWRIHAQFPPSGRDDAIEEAKTLESLPGLSGIKVVRDNYDDRTGLHREHMVYKHIPKKTAASSSDAGSPSSGGGKYAHYLARASANRMDDIDFGDTSNARPVKTSRLGVFTKLMLVLLFSIAVSAIVVGLMNGFMPYKQIAGIKLYGVMRSNIMIGTAIATFLLSVLLTYLAFMRGDELDAVNLARQEKIKRQADDKRRQDEAKRKAEEEQRKQTLSKEEEDERKKQAEEELKRKAEAEAAENGDENGEDAKEEEKEEEEFSGLSPAAEAQKAVLMGFFGEAVRALPAERRKMDNYNRFGVNLYLAGAAESLGGTGNLDADSIAEILASSLGVMGLKPEHAQAFAKRYEDYLLQDARYMEMFQSGRQTMMEYLGGDKESPKKLDAFLHEWNKPKAPEDPEKEVVVMFTDIVGSTAMTHEKGNLAAQEVVRAHNRVVREALSKTGGHEIKHTGDGIMASFEQVTDSLLSTQQMQMMIELHNQQAPEIPLKVKIGINAGRVVMEERTSTASPCRWRRASSIKPRPIKFSFLRPFTAWPRAARGGSSNVAPIISKASTARRICKNWCGTTKSTPLRSRLRPSPSARNLSSSMSPPAASRCPVHQPSPKRHRINLKLGKLNRPQ